MEYTKPSLTFDDQADLLLQRGMQGDKTLMIERLRAVNYYRLSGYWYNHRIPNTDNFKPDTNFETIWTHYVFDRRLRLLTLDLIERFEIAVKTKITYLHSRKFGPFAYIFDSKSLPGLKDFEWSGFVVGVQRDVDRSQADYMKSFRAKYGDKHQFPPIWMATEAMSFGTIQKLFQGFSPDLKKEIANDFGIPDEVISSWIPAINIIRNVCAHHGRLWNLRLSRKPLIPGKNKHPQWHMPEQMKNDKIHSILTILVYLLKRTAPQSRWVDRFKVFLDEFPPDYQDAMGFPKNWMTCPIWQ